MKLLVVGVPSGIKSVTRKLAFKKNQQIFPVLIVTIMIGVCRNVKNVMLITDLSIFLVNKSNILKR
jgi:hypothetical protein